MLKYFYHQALSRSSNFSDKTNSSLTLGGREDTETAVSFGTTLTVTVKKVITVTTVTVTVTTIATGTVSLSSNSVIVTVGHSAP